MTGPEDDDMSLDVSCFDDERHEARFGFALNKAHEIYDRDEQDQDDETQDEEN